MTEDVTEIFAVVVETKDEGPLLHETLGKNTSYKVAQERMKFLLGSPGVIRACVVRLEFAYGNELLPHDMKRMQE